MTTKLIKRTIEETTGTEGEVVEKVVAIEFKVLDENENQVGSAVISKHGVNISLYGSEFDIEDWTEKVNNFLNDKENE